MSKQFTQLCFMSQERLKKYVTKELRKTHPAVIVDDGYVYAQGKFPVLLVAHLDTVHDKLPTSILYNTKENSVSSTNGIGGDDRCGVYMILEIIKKYNCSVLFCEDEEIGCVGADKFACSETAKGLQFNYIMEFDRKGKNDAVFYDCDNPEFEDFITKEFYKTNTGSFSDISAIAPFLGCAAVNLSCGYYKAHTKEEYVVLSEMEKSIQEACKILERTTENDKFEYIEAEHFYSRYAGPQQNYFGDAFYFMFSYINEEGKEEWYDTYAASEAEAIGMFCIDNDTIPYRNITDIFCEEAY